MQGYLTNIEAETLENTDYRRVLYTTDELQLVVMSLAPGQEIGEEVHELSQFIRVEAGQGVVVLAGETQPLPADHAVVIPAGTRHNVRNEGAVDLKLYSIYAPPEHQRTTVHPGKADETEEHFDGSTDVDA
ncbi:cupin domain-containing protein [Patescibacteria group bacterium]|nr:cupin domain-containing protein [Patescibacteria group bacterium]